MSHPARTLWQHVEPVHATTYFAPEVAESLAAAGSEGWWRGYFAARAGPLGATSPEVVQATFFGFAPVLVRRCVPSAWDRCPPERAVAARDAGVLAAFDRLGVTVVPRTVELAERAVAACRPEGRALFAAHAAWTATHPVEDLRLRLWWATTLLREHRGDGHVAALTAAGVGGCEANRLAHLEGAVPDRQPSVRGWTDEEWAAAGDLAATRPPGFRAELEARTDELAAGPVEALGPEGLEELCAGLRPVVERLAASGTIPYPNPIGVPPLP